MKNCSDKRLHCGRMEGSAPKKKEDLVQKGFKPMERVLLILVAVESITLLTYIPFYGLLGYV